MTAAIPNGVTALQVIGLRPTEITASPDRLYLQSPERYEFFDITDLSKRYVINLATGLYVPFSGTGGTGATTFAALTDPPTANSQLNAALLSKLGTAVPWDPTGNTPALASGVYSSGGVVFSSAIVPVAVTVPIVATIYPNDWLVYTPSISQWVQVSYAQLLVSCPDLLTADLSQNVTIVALAANILTNTLAIGALKILPTSVAFSTTWDTSSTKDMGNFTVTGPLSLVSSSVNSLPGGYTQATIVADGTNVPTMDGLAIAGYTNTAGYKNRTKFERTGDTTYTYCLNATSGSLSKGAFAMPAITGSPTPIASFDFGDSSKITLASGSIGAGGLISGVAGSDGTTFSLVQATGAKQPTSVVRNFQLTARFTGGQFLQCVSAMGRTNSTTGFTMIAVVEFATNAATQAVCEMGATGSPFGSNRDLLYASIASGYSFRHNDNSTQSTANSGTTFTAAIHLMVGRTPAGSTGLTGKLNLDGTATTVVSGTVNTSTMSVNAMTVGGTLNSGSLNNPLDGYVTRIWTFNSELSDAQIEQFAVACAAQYSTPNAS